MKLRFITIRCFYLYKITVLFRELWRFTFVGKLIIRRKMFNYRNQRFEL